MLQKTIVLQIILLISFSSIASYTDYWIKQGDIAFNKQQIEESIVHYSRAIEERPKQPLGYLKRAKAYRASGSFVRAAEDMQEALRLDPQFTKSYLELGRKNSNPK